MYVMRTKETQERNGGGVFKADMITDSMLDVALTIRILIFVLKGQQP